MLPGWKLAPGRDSVVGSAGGELWRGAGGARRTGVGALEWPSGCSGTRASLDSGSGNREDRNAQATRGLRDGPSPNTAWGSRQVGRSGGAAQSVRGALVCLRFF